MKIKKYLSHLKRDQPDIYKVVFETEDNIVCNYRIHISRHSKTQRKLSNTRGSEDRLVEGLSIKRFDYIMAPHLEKLLTDHGKYLVVLEKFKSSSERIYLLVVSEPDKFEKNGTFISLITSIIDSTSNVTFKKIPIQNRLISKLYYDDLLEIRMLMTEEELKVAKRNDIVEETKKVYISENKGLKIIKRNKDKVNQYD